MNIFLQKLFLGLILILAVPLIGVSQEIEKTTYRDTPLEYTFVSYPTGPNLITRPSNGTATLTDLGGSNYSIYYEPNPGFVGDDLIRFTVWFGTGWEFRTLAIKVLPSKVEAKTDLVYTFQDTGIDIDILSNDFTSSGELAIKQILLANNGAVQVIDDQGWINFMPSEGFSGIAQFNYVACDNLGACDQGTVIVNVFDDGGDSADTLRIFTKREQPQTVLVPKDFTLAVPPENGSYDNSGDLPTYTPENGFVGHDFLQLTDGDMVKTVEVTVLDVVNNSFAYDDEVFTSPYEGVEFNVLENDYYGQASGCLNLTQPRYGRVEENVWPAGSLTYTPEEGFTGVDQFTYTIQPPGCEEASETATVYVYVSEFEPAYSKFRMATPKRTPLIIGYNIPIRNFEFEITDQAELGEARFLSGRVDTTIYGQRILGYNIILYVPGEEVNAGTDEFEVVYCVNNNGECQTRKLVKIEVDILDIGDGSQPMCFDDCIWAGDTNFDGIVNMEDLLPLGVYMGKVGQPREGISMDLWYGQYGDDWGESFDGREDDIKHVDTNGDSIISARDTFAISRFYGRTHSLTPQRVPDYKHTIRLEGDLFVSPGDLVELDLVLGSAENPAVDVYGFTFPFNYNPDFFRPESAEVDFENHSWLSYHSPTLSMMRNNGEGLVESGFTRTNGLPTSGFGEIGKVRAVVIEEIDGLRPEDEEITVEIGGGVATLVDGAGNTFGVEVEGVTLHINLQKEEEEILEDPEAAARRLKVYPNPAHDQLNVYLNGGHDFERVWIYNIAGQQIFDSGNLQTRQHQIDLNNLSEGFYVLRVQTQKGLIHKKFEIMR